MLRSASRCASRSMGHLRDGRLQRPPQGEVANEDALKRLSQAPGEVLDILPGDAARAAAAPERPGERLFLQNAVLDVQAVMPGIGPHHVEILVLAAIVEADPQPEAIRQRELLLDGPRQG